MYIIKAAASDLQEGGNHTCIGQPDGEEPGGEHDTKEKGTWLPVP